MSEREELAGLLSSRNWDRQPLMNPQARWNAHADAILASDWLAARDDRIRADIAAEVLAAKVAAWDEGWRVGASGRNILNPYRTLSTAKADE